MIPLGTAGLTKPDLSLRFYADGVAKAAIASALTVTELAGGDYRIGGLPDAVAGTWRTLTWEYPPGVGGQHAYPTGALQPAAPPNLILPVRETGLVAANFSFALYKDGAAQADAISATEIGSPGDYRVSGWPTDEAGRFSLVWRRHGISYGFAWRVTNAGTVVGFSEYHDALRAFLDVGLQAQSPATLVYWPGFDAPYKPGATAPSPAPTQSASTPPWIRMTVLTSDNPNLTSHVREHYGRVVIQVFQPPGQGSGKNEDLIAKLQAIFERQSVAIATGNLLQITHTRIKEIGPDSEGWLQTNFEASWSWTQRDVA